MYHQGPVALTKFRTILSLRLVLNCQVKLVKLAVEKLATSSSKSEMRALLPWQQTARTGRHKDTAVFIVFLTKWTKSALYIGNSSCCLFHGKYLDVGKSSTKRNGRDRDNPI